MLRRIIPVASVSATIVLSVLSANAASPMWANAGNEGKYTVFVDFDSIQTIPNDRMTFFYQVRDGQTVLKEEQSSVDCTAKKLWVAGSYQVPPTETFAQVVKLVCPVH